MCNAEACAGLRAHFLGEIQQPAPPKKRRSRLGHYPHPRRYFYGSPPMSLNLIAMMDANAVRLSRII